MQGAFLYGLLHLIETKFALIMDCAVKRMAVKSRKANNKM